MVLSGAGRGGALGAEGLVRWVGGVVLGVVVPCCVCWERVCSSWHDFGICVVVGVGVSFVGVMVVCVSVRVCTFGCVVVFSIVDCCACVF